MDLLSFLLVVFVTTGDGEVNSFVMDSQLSYADCALSGASIEPMDARAVWVCVPDLRPHAEEPFSLLVADYE